MSDLQQMRKEQMETRWNSMTEEQRQKILAQLDPPYPRVTSQELKKKEERDRYELERRGF